MKRFSYDEVCIRNSCWHKIFMQKALHFYYYSIQISWYYWPLLKLMLFQLVHFLMSCDLFYMTFCKLIFQHKVCLVNIIHITSYFQYNFAILPLHFSLSSFFIPWKNQKCWHDALLVHYWESLLCFFPGYEIPSCGTTYLLKVFHTPITLKAKYTTR